MCSLLFRSTFFLLRESLLAADRDFFLSVHEEGELHEMSPALFGAEDVPLANPSSGSHLCPWSLCASFHPWAIPGLI